jgi:hypothetical protein
LTAGVGNLDPLPPGQTLVNCQTLAAACLSAMGAGGSAPATMNAVSPPRQIEWLGAHAPSELARLLEHTGHVYCPHSSGLGVIQRLLTGGVPTIPADRVVSDITVPGVSRLPQIAIFISSPNAVIRTYNDQAATAPGWEFVAQNPANGYAWEALDVAAAETNVRNGFKDVAEKDRQLAHDQVFRCIRLKSDRFDRLQSPLLREVYLPDGTVDQPHLITTVAVQDPQSGAWLNRQTRLNAQTVDGTNNILVFDRRIGKVKDADERADFDPFFLKIDAATLKPAYSVEDWQDGKKVYAVYGFEISGGAAGAMSESAARSYLTGYRPDTGIFSAPELQCVWLNDDTSNESDLATAAQGMAQALLVEGLSPRTIHLKGYYPCEINGRVSEVSYSPESPATTITIDGWSCPSGGGVRDGRRGRGSSRLPGGGSGEIDDGATSISKQKSRRHGHACERSRSRQIGRGASLGHQPATPTNVARSTSSGFRFGLAKVGDPVASQAGRFNGRTYSGKFNRAATGNYAIADIGAEATADDCVLWGVGKNKIPLSKDQPVLTMFGPVMDSGKLIGAAIPLPGLYQVKVTKDGGAAGTSAVAATWTYTVKTLDGATFATAVPLYKTRPKGNRAFAPADSIAWVFYDADTLKIWDLNETDGTAGC